MEKRIVVLSGGFSEEKEVSKTSASEISKALIAMNYNVQLIDPVDYDSFTHMIQEIKRVNPSIVFNALHGAEGEDGRIQAMLALEKIPFTGSKHTASAIAMNKYVSNQIATAIGVPVPKTVALWDGKLYQVNEVIDQLGLPVVIKPNDAGSSVGINIANSKEEVEKYIQVAFEYAKLILVQEFIDGRELTVSVLAEEALPVVEIAPKEGFYDYINKYTKGKTVYSCPADLTEEENKKVSSYALDIFHTMGCEVYSRIDFRFNGKEFYFLEVNTLPGMTPLSLTPMAAKARGYSFEQLIMTIINNSSK